MACLVLLGWLGDALGQTVVLDLKNGDRLSGEVIAQTESNLVLRTLWGEVSVPLDQVAEKAAPAAPATPEAAPPALTREAIEQALAALSQQYLAGTLSPSEYHRKKAQLMEAVAAVPPPPPPPPAPAAAEPVPVQAAAPAAGGKKPDQPKQQWGGQVQIGADAGSGTKDRLLFSGRVKLTHAYNRLRNNADYSFTYGTTDGDLSANRMDGALKTDWNLTKRFYLYNIGGGGYDVIREIDLKYEVGPGTGYHILQLKRMGLSGEVGLNYYVEEREVGEDREKFYYRLAENFTWKLTDRISLDEQFEVFPQAEAIHNYRTRFEANVQYLIGAYMSLTFTLLHQYDTDPAPGVDHSDVQLRSMLGVKF